MLPTACLVCTFLAVIAALYLGLSLPHSLTLLLGLTEHNLLFLKATSSNFCMVIDLLDIFVCILGIKTHILITVVFL